MDKSKILFFFSALGVFNGFIVSVYLLFFRKKNKLPNYFLGLLVLMLSIRIGKSVYMVYNENDVLLYIQIGLSACFLIGVMLFYFIKATLDDVKKVPSSWKIHIGILLLVILAMGIWKPYQTERAFWNTYFVRFIYYVWGAYVLLSGYLLRDVIKRFIKKRSSCTVQEVWLLVVYASVFAIYLAYNIGRRKWYISGAISFSVVSYLVIFFLMFKKNRKEIFTEEQPKYASKKIETTEAESLIKKLKEVMSEKQLYKNSDVKLKHLADELNISTHHLSQLLNDNLGKSFALYINGLRIEEAKQLLQKNDQFTLEAIGLEAGFSSKSTFYATFKKLVGSTPAEFKKQYS